MDVLQELQVWYSKQCNGEWEEDYGITIDTIDNPGWFVKIQVKGTYLENVVFEEIDHSRDDEQWYRCWKKDETFRGVGDPSQLTRLLTIFLTWAHAHKPTAGNE